MKTQSTPSRGSIDSAVRTAPSSATCSEMRLRSAARRLRHADGLLEMLRLGQRPARLHRVLLMDVGIGGRRHEGEGFHRQAIADRRIARHQKQFAAAQRPALADPARARRGRRVPALDRQHEAGRARQAALESAHHAGALFGIVDLGIGRIDIDRQRVFLQQPIGGVFIGGHDIIGLDAEPPGEFGGDRLARPRSVAAAGPETPAISAGSLQIGLPSLRQ